MKINIGGLVLTVTLVLSALFLTFLVEKFFGLNFDWIIIIPVVAVTLFIILVAIKPRPIREDNPQ